jgi:hypothetical protein
MELPLVLTGYVNRQEEGNVRWAEASGLGRWVEPRRVPETVQRLLGGTELQAMRQAARRQKEHRPSADAAGAILELAGAAREVCV